MSAPASAIVTVRPIDAIPGFEIDVPLQMAIRGEVRLIESKGPKFAVPIELADALIVDWRGTECVFGEPMLPTPRNKKLVLESSLVVREATEGKPPVYASVFLLIQNKLDEQIPSRRAGK